MPPERFCYWKTYPVPGFLKPVANVLGDATKYFFKYGDDFLDLVKVNNVVKFTDNTIRKLAKKATKFVGNIESEKVMLGKYGEGGIFYKTEAEKFGCCYYSLDFWDNVKNLVNGDQNQMWEINKQFIISKKGKTFYTSHDPNLATDFFKNEIDLIKSWEGFVRFEKEGNYWKAIFN